MFYQLLLFYGDSTCSSSERPQAGLYLVPTHGHRVISCSSWLKQLLAPFSHPVSLVYSSQCAKLTIYRATWWNRAQNCSKITIFLRVTFFWDRHPQTEWCLCQGTREKVRSISSTSRVCARTLPFPSLACWPRSLWRRLLCTTYLLLLLRREAETNPQLSAPLQWN